MLSSFEFFKGCAPSPGASLVLDHLVDEVKKGGKKRKCKTVFNIAYGQPANNISGDERDAPKPSISPKRDRQQDLLSGLATRASERRKRIREIITDIKGSSD